ncbi:MAG: RNA-protein complex protein Nop10 [Candidatus Aenigmatarchaeota archaeon]
MEMKKCKSCGRYTLETECPECGGKAVNPNPGPFSPEDKHGEYRRKEKLKKMCKV